MVARKLLRKYPDETVQLVYHGGSCVYLYKWLTRSSFDGLATYILFGVYKLNDYGDEDWEALAVNELTHMKYIKSVDHKGFTFELLLRLSNFSSY